MSLVDRASKPVVPAEWQKHSVQEGDEGKACTGPVTELVTDEGELLTLAGLDPDQWMIEGKIHQWTKETPAGETLRSFFFGYKRRVEQIDLPALYAEVKRTKFKPARQGSGCIDPVVSWADMQLGKQGSRGGTKELLERLDLKRAKLDAHLKASGCTHSVFVDAGDPTEGFENVASQMFTNDLSLPQQIDLAAVEMWKTLVIMAKYGPVDAIAVPSNHGAWRSGKQMLGKPGDDWGLTIQRRLEFQAELIGLPVTFHRPDEWDESVAIDVRGTVLGVHHGHQSAEDQMAKWWAGQQHGGQALADVDILLTGHYHHLRIQPTGRNRRTGRSKWWLQSPTLDNGSDWFRNHAGDDSDPGLLVFGINDEGLDLQSLVVL
jgi:hypothetical protein